MGMILFMTVGTGTGQNADARKNLAHGLLVSVEHYRPDKCVFFGSEKSKETIEELKKQYIKSRGKEIEYESVVFSNGEIDNFNILFRRMKEKLEEYVSDDIVIDYTSGTKTMTMCAAIVSMLYHKKLSLVTGTRSLDGIVICGTEMISEQNLYLAYDDMLFSRFKELFNAYRFDEAIRNLDEIKILDEKDKYRTLAIAYNSWDKFMHRETHDLIESLKDKRLAANKSFLGNVLNNSKLSHLLKLADLLNNAERRIEESKYDDAVARLYRAIELIAQIKLKEYGLNELDGAENTINLAKLEEIGIDIEKYKMYSDNKKVRLGLEKKYELLKDCGWEDAKSIYLENADLKNLLMQRNNSILAHGLNTTTKETAVNLLSEAKRHAKTLHTSIERTMNDASFIKL